MAQVIKINNHFCLSKLKKIRQNYDLYMNYFSYLNNEYVLHEVCSLNRQLCQGCQFLWLMSSIVEADTPIINNLRLLNKDRNIIYTYVSQETATRVFM